MSGIVLSKQSDYTEAHSAEELAAWRALAETIAEARGLTLIWAEEADLGELEALGQFRAAERDRDAELDVWQTAWDGVWGEGPE